MTKEVRSCGTNDNLQRAAQIMWENDCGAVPVTAEDGRVVGMVTDRDICMAAYTQGQPLWNIPVPSAMANQVHVVREADSLDVVETLMRNVRVRRVPVIDADGRLKGIVSMNDLARHSRRSGGRNADGLSGDSIVQTLASICMPHAAPSGLPPAGASAKDGSPAKRSA
jgi:CBS-domain-containing membrane protein